MKKVLAAFTISLLLVLSGCSKLLGSLRSDMDDVPPHYEPTVGGLYPGGYVAPEDFDGLLSPYSRPYNRVGHSERGPADQFGRDRGPGSWVSQEQNNANRRDFYRDGVRYSENPNMVPSTKRQYKTKKRVTRKDFIDRSPDAGSLWAPNGQTNYFFTRNRIKEIGDIVTLKIQDPLIDDMSMEIKKTLSEEELKAELALAQERLMEQAVKDREEAKLADAKSGKKKKKKEDGEEVADGEEEEEKEEELEVRKATWADVDIKKTIPVKADEEILAEIIDRYPNGNYKIRGSKKVAFQGNTRTLTVVGVAPANDINDKDSVESGKLYEYRIKAFR